MFGAGGGGIWGSIAAPNDSLLTKPRAPPPRPLPLDFPNHQPPFHPSPLSRQRMKHLRRTILSLRRPTDSQQNDLVMSLMNTHVTTDVPLHALLPSDFLPRRPYPLDSDLEAMLAELGIENEDAYREVLRQAPREGKARPKVAYARGFFGGLEDMSRYVDASKDNYYYDEPDVADDEAKDEGNENQTTSDGSNSNDSGSMHGRSSNSSSSSSSSTITTNAISTNDTDGDTPMSNTSTSDTSKSLPTTINPTPTTNDKELYTGLRLGTLAQLPPQTRTSTVRHFLKLLTHKFSSRDYDPSPRERLRIGGNINLPQGLVMYSFCVAKMPTDRVLARNRWVEGPVLGVSVRHECVFDGGLYERFLKGRDEGGEGRTREEVGDCLGSQVDLLREVGAALALAMQRNREGKSREKEAERLVGGWWWASKPRWGGGETRWGQMANEVYEEEDPSWSPEERRLQVQKRERVEGEMKRMERIASVTSSERGLDVQDLIAGSERDAAQGTGGGGSTGHGSGVGLLAEKNSTRIPVRTPTEAETNALIAGSGNEDRQRPSKRNRLSIPERGGDPQASLSSSSSTSSSNNTAPSFSTISGRAGGSMTSSSAATSPTTPDEARSQRDSKREKDREEKAEYRDGRRLMYTPPMRRKWFKEWANVKVGGGGGAGAVLGWDEKVVWRRVGAPGNSSTTHKDDKERSAAGADMTNAEARGDVEGPGGARQVASSGGAAATTHQGGEGDGEEVGAGAGVEDDGEDSDTIYQISALNHHVALVRMRVSRRYLRWVESGDPDSPPLASSSGTSTATTTSTKGRVAQSAAQQSTQGGGDGDAEVKESDILRVERSKYYDLFSVEERKEFFVALWRVMCYLLRGEGVVKGELERLRGQEGGAKMGLGG